MIPVEIESNERTEKYEERSRKEKKERIEQSQQIPLHSNELPIKGSYKHTFINIDHSIDESKYDWRRRTTNWQFKKEFSKEVFEDEDFICSDRCIKAEFSLLYVSCCSNQHFTVWVHPNTILGSILNCVLKQPISNYFIANEYLLDETYFDKTLNEIIELLDEGFFEVRVKDWYGRRYFKKFKSVPFNELKQNLVLVQRGFKYEYIDLSKRNRELIKYSNVEHPPRVNDKLYMMKTVSTQTQVSFLCP